MIKCKSEEGKTKQNKTILLFPLKKIKGYY